MLIKFSLTGNAQGIQLVISILLKTAVQLFTLYKALVLPSRLSHDTFFTFQIDYCSFGLAINQRDYALLTEADLQQCTAGSITICPSRAPLYPTQVLTCEGSLFFQSPHSYSLCRKSLLLHHQTPTLQHHGSKWVFHFPEQRQATIRCPQENGWTSHAVTLWGSGIIYNASVCHIASQAIRTLPVLSKSVELHLDVPHLYLPDEVSLVTSQGVSRIEAAMPSEATVLDRLKARLVTPGQSFDVYMLLQVRQQSVRAARESH